MIEVSSAFLIGETAQQIFAHRTIGTVHTLVRAQVSFVMPYHVTHQPHEGQIDRALEGLFDGRNLTVFEGLEVMKDVEAAAGEEFLERAGGIATLHRGV